MQTHQGYRNLLSPLHVRQQIRSASKRHGLCAFAIQDARSFFHGFGRAKFEKRQPHHGVNTFSFSVRGFERWGTSFTAFPSPPSHSGRRRTTSVQFTGGKTSEPERRSRPATLADSAFTIFSRGI